ncbi:long-chain fatty acid--CoA ligase [Amycolatopsis cynarae]|uniref:Long-chain fatty acid--CoA ligase n=1 Tax=Amycolatopsis cynarae TaxID=2995223 RepID=A0ABY7BEN1_9PSEU|nr:long-chain fatty acid--CoA ligase [Amycolatopsis sp. HUAS 11-8]WAL69361.1 long-chain fatty acid--CoA ligase [Amycolatopsis sp. HUAS 11-8]
MTDIGVGSWPRRRARMDPGAVALVQGDRRITYGGLARRTAALAAALSGLGVRKGDRVAYLGPNAIATFEAFFATTSLGAIHVALNARLTAPELSFLLDDSGARVLFLAPETEAEGLAAVEASTTRPRVVRLAAEYERLVDEQAGRKPPPVEVALDDPALILYTSGTTGRPKGAVLTHGNITWNTLNQFAHFALGHDDVALCSAPLFHVLGLGQITLPTLYAGGTVVVIAKFDPGDFLATIERERATAFPLAPTMLQMLCDHPAWEKTDLASVRLVVFGGSPVLERVAKSWLDRGIQALQGYGMTEAAPGVFMALGRGARERPTSAGVPHFFVEVALLMPDGRIVTGPGQGELLVKGPNVFSGYWNRPEATADAFVDGWFRTGDVVRLGEDGWAQIVDRVKDLIISGGENVYPAEVEAAIRELDAVEDCAVVAVPDAQWGETGMAFVVTRPARRLGEEEIRTHLRHRLAKYKIPRYFTFCPALPRNATGKIQRRVLRERAETLRLNDDLS